MFVDRFMPEFNLVVINGRSREKKVFGVERRNHSKETSPSGEQERIEFRDGRPYFISSSGMRRIVSVLSWDELCLF